MCRVRVCVGVCARVCVWVGGCYPSENYRKVEIKAGHPPASELSVAHTLISPLSNPLGPTLNEEIAQLVPRLGPSD